MNDLGIASMSMAMSQSKVMQQVNTAVLGKVLDFANVQAANELSMIESAGAPAPMPGADPALGNHIDAYA